MRTIVLFLTALGVAQAPLRAQLPTITNQPVNRTVWAGANVTLAVGVSGAGPFTYQWQLNTTNLPNGIITTVAGGGAGDGGAATNACLGGPFAVAMDTRGNLFIANENDCRIRKVGTNGIITTVAGNGGEGYSGDGAAAANATLNSPSGLAVDASGNVFIADSNNGRVRKVDTNGIITTVAGNGTAGFSGDGAAATNAGLGPTGVAVDGSGNLFIADSRNNRIRKVNTSGIITTLAGNGAAGSSGDGAAATNASLSYPFGLAVDASGNVFMADTQNNRIRKVNTSGIITTVAGSGAQGYSGDGGAATNASLAFPNGVTVDGAGNLFIADINNKRIRMVGANGIITTSAGNGTMFYYGDGGIATNAGLGWPTGVAVDGSGNLFIADYGNSRIRKVNTNGTITTVAGNGAWVYSGDGAAATNASLSFPSGLAVDASGNLFIADSFNNRIRKVNINGIITTVAGNGGQGYSGDGAAATNASLSSPRGVAVDASGNLLIADSFNERIRKVNTNGIITTVAGNGTFGGGYSGDGGAATNASLNSPNGLAVDASGNLFIADSFNERIRKVDPSGTITTVAGNGFITNVNSGMGAYSGDGGAATNANLSLPCGVALDSSGNLLIADYRNNCIRKVSANGIITTVTGNGFNASRGFGACSGDDGTATNASLNEPACVVVDASGNLFIADTQNNRIRKVTRNQGPTLALTNVNAANAGSYQLVVTGPGGSVTSSPATLSVTTSPLIYATTGNSDGSVTLSFVSPPGSTNVVLCATNFAPPVLWQPVSTNIAGADGDWQFSDASAASSPEGFYRFLTQ